MRLPRFGAPEGPAHALPVLGETLLGSLLFALAASASPPAQGPINFAQTVRPLFLHHCLRCHGPDRQKAGLRLDRKDLALHGGKSGPLLVAGKSSASLLLRRLTATAPEERMPAGAEPLPPEEIELIRRWIDQGARWPDAMDGQASGSGHWSFQPIRAPAPPPVSRHDWPRDPIDAFILARLEKEHLSPSSEADRPTLLRRLSLDLLGLPPTPAEARAFLQDPRPDAYERLVERLLASPHFGERWGEHWLDLARYADSDGYEQDDARPYAYRWRDWAIRAINADQPFDQFTIEQLAGDLLPQATAEQVLATGFHRNAPTNGEGGIDKEEARLQALVDRVNTTGTVWLGLTVGCAECHSHKFDPLPQTEYYQLLAFFNDQVDEAEGTAPPTAEDARQTKIAVAAYEERVATLRARLEGAAPEERKIINDFLRRALKKGPPKLKVELAVFGPAAKPRQTFVHLGGDFLRRGPHVMPGVPAVLPPLVSRRGSQAPPDRLDLARWLVDPANPLTARVEVNRIWQYLFGTGLVSTPDDFGTQGEPPSHPGLLDYLAARFRQQGWSRKALIRAIVTSATYRQASARRLDGDALDPNNRLLHRQNRFRLEAETIRDSILAAAGLLDPTLGGPGVRPPLPDGFKNFAYRFQWSADPPPYVYRRAVYLFFQRNMIFPMLRTFDRSDTNLTCVRRERSNTPVQALLLLNDPRFMEAYRSLGLQLWRDPHTSVAERIDALVLRGLGREPSPAERRILADLFASLRSQYQADPRAAAALAGAAPDSAVPCAERAAWVGVARVVLNTDTFTSRE
jgi:hypothetical protein